MHVAGDDNRAAQRPAADAQALPRLRVSDRTRSHDPARAITERPAFALPSLRLSTAPAPAPATAPAPAVPSAPPRPAEPIRPVEPAPVPRAVAAPRRTIQTSAAPAISVRGLTKHYERSGPKVVDGIDLTVSPGEIYGFLGPNGAGKSTTVNMLVTLLPPTSGEIRIAGLDAVAQPGAVRRQIGAALQSVALDPFLTAREHLRLVASLHGASPAHSSARIEQMLDRVGLTQAADRRCGGFSGGMKRRLDLALALVHGPTVLFLDEPTTGLDPQSRTALWEEVRRLAHDEGVTVFLTTQYLEEADQLADRIGIIDRGTIVAEGTPDALKAQVGAPTVEVSPGAAVDRERLLATLGAFGTASPARRPGNLAVRLDTAGGRQPSLLDVVRTLDEAQLAVDEVRLFEPSLDDVFLTHTGRSLEGGRK